MSSNTIEQYDLMLKTLKEVNDLCAKAQGHYHAAMGLEARADRADQRAKFGAVWDGAGFFEKMDQHSEAKKMNRARDEANQGSAELRKAFALIPRDGPCLLRDRYPEEMSKIGTVPIPQLEGGHFGGAMMADMAGRGFGAEMNAQRKQREINRNLEVIRQCEIICGEQQQLLATVTKRVNADRNGLASGDQNRATTPSPEGSAPTSQGDTTGERPTPVTPTPSEPTEVYVDGGMGMGGGMERRGGMGMGMGMGMMEGMMMEEMMIDDRRRREDREFMRREEFGRPRRDEFRRPGFERRRW